MDTCSARSISGYASVNWRRRGIRMVRAKVGVTASFRPPAPGRRGGAGKALQRAQPFAHMGQVGAAVGGERKICPAKQPRAQNLLQLLDAVADRAGRDAQLVGRQRHAAQARQRLEGKQALDGRDAPCVAAWKAGALLLTGAGPCGGRRAA